MASKTLILIRHAHRDNTHPELDNGLTPKGWRQASALERFFTERFGVESPKLISSPKKRCVETLQPLSEHTGVEITPDERLLEQQSFEKEKQVRDRIKLFLKTWEEKSWPITVVCSHGDWIPMAISQCLQISVLSKKGSWIELDWEEGRWTLSWMIQSFKRL